MIGNILIINDNIIYPPHRCGSANTLFQLSQQWIKLGWNVKLIYLSHRDECNEKELEKKGLTCECADIAEDKPNYYLFFSKPRNMWAYNYKKLNVIDVSDYDYVILGSFIAGEIFHKITWAKQRPKILFFEADCTSMYYKRRALLEDNVIKRFYCEEQYKLIEKIENRLYPEMDTTIFVSDIDEGYVKKRNRSIKTATIKIGVQVLNHVSKINFGGDYFNIGFSGIMDYEPNVMAVNFIISKLMPRLDKTNINYRVHIVGKNPQEEWKLNSYYKQKKLILTGFVNDIDQYISSLDLYISPLFLGTGMKNKILQAMADSVPFIASQVSVEGINELKDGENFALCDTDPDKWVERIQDAYIHKDKYKDYAKKNFTIVKEYYSWESVARKFLNHEK